MTFPARKLGEIASVLGGKRLPKGHDFSPTKTNHLYIRGKDIRDGRIGINEPVYISEETHRLISRYVVNNNNVCITIVGNIGDVGIATEKTDGANLTENAIKLVGTDKDYCDLFVMYALLSPEAQSQMKNYAAGAAQAKLGIYKIKEIQIPYPPLETQRKIASILSGYDDLIENNTRRIMILEEMSQAIYREWFVNLRFPGHEQVKMVDSPLGRVPEGWEVKKVGDLLQKVSRNKKIPKQDYLNQGEIPVVDQGRDFIGGYTADEEALIEEPLPLIVFGDHTRILKYIDFPFACGADGTQLLRANTLRMPTTLLYYALLQIDLSSFSYARHFKFLKEEELVVPDQKTASLFEMLMGKMRDQISCLAKKNQNLSRSRNLLLPKLTSGDISFTD